MSARRRRALSVMEHLRRADIDTLRREQADVIREMSELTEARTSLEEKLRTERHNPTPEAMPYVAGFVDALTSQINATKARIRELEPILAAFERKQTALFQEQKVYETVRLSDLHRERAERQRKEQAEIEELTLLRWGRD
ncbi:hypothetical protein ACRARG_17490 [Pseudooceanicola sp. C21-150M6]|uniref:hypothetical protein n=1 Tax=Pseudooceanicola sp. C21-150M6 TaxID=3434355 RepID=UPI003D7F239C